jgi:hypothetical protein
MTQERDIRALARIMNSIGIKVLPRINLEFGGIPEKDSLQRREASKLTREINKIATDEKLIELIDYQQELIEQKNKFKNDLDNIKSEELPDIHRVQRLEKNLEDIKNMLYNIGKIIKGKRKLIYDLHTEYFKKFDIPYEEYKNNTGTYFNGGPDLLLEQRKKREEAASSAVESRASTTNRMLRKKREEINKFITSIGLPKNTPTSLGGANKMKVKKPLKKLVNKPVVKAVKKPVKKPLKKPLKKLVKKPVVKPAKKKVATTRARK